jgi:ribonuclease P protein component
MKKQFTLGKEERLKSRKQIERLFNEGKKFSIPPFRVHYLFSELAGPPLQFGVGVSNKNFKRAVDRNRIKRLVKEAYRLQKITLHQRMKEKKGQLHVFFIYNGKEIPLHPEVFDKMNTMLDKLIHIIDQEN